MVKGDKCWIIENGLKVISADVLSISGNLVLIKTQDGKTLRLPKHRLYNNEESAVAVMQKRNPVEKSKTPYDYMND